MLVNQPTAAPTQKMQAVGAAGAGVAAVVTLLAIFGVIVPEDVSKSAEGGIAALFVLVSAVQAVVTFAAGYLKKNKA
jgi:hypothetical protein